jgi:hypothetical protein
VAGLPQRLKHLAVLRLPPCMAERMAEEWQAHLDDTPAPARTLAALGFVVAAMRCKLVARFGPVAKTEILMKPAAARYMAAALQRRVAALKRDQDGVNLTEIVREVEEAFQGEPGVVKIIHKVVGPVERLRFRLGEMAERLRHRRD